MQLLFEFFWCCCCVKWHELIQWQKSCHTLNVHAQTHVALVNWLIGFSSGAHHLLEMQSHNFYALNAMKLRYLERNGAGMKTEQEICQTAMALEFRTLRPVPDNNTTCTLQTMATMAAMQYNGPKYRIKCKKKHKQQWNMLTKMAHYAK